ncbi:hypothetical protein F3Y22_tig00110575pilonHSYRG00018 [Hibiscus syriacus]|uniref:CCHC-type domain-containing protein n=1 Tax=Hibiscus syriacus TaxID=106335 RepID=A0A6A3A943_HIBSY|nr:hypothetical protein F3Y22_tig00110575pilonHSYRG00018 [Hibiscus syriacus]
MDTVGRTVATKQSCPKAQLAQDNANNEVGNNINNGKSSVVGFSEDEMVILEEDIIMDRSGPVPLICFSDPVHEHIDKNMCNIIMIRLLGRTIGYNTMAKRIYAIWKLVGKIQLRGKSARLAVLVDLNKPLLSCIRIDGSLQRLEYEGLQQVCFECGLYGHAKEQCSLSKNVTNVAAGDDSSRTDNNPTDKMADTHACGSGNNAAILPNYMVATESAKARIRSESAPRQRSYTPERDRNGSARKRLSFPVPEPYGVRRGYGGYGHNLRSSSFKSVTGSHLGLEQQSNFSSCYTESHGGEISPSSTSDLRRWLR